MSIHIPIEILEHIASYCDSNKMQLFVSMINKYVYNNFHFDSLDISSNQLFNDDLIKQERFSRLRALNCSNNNHITYIGHLSKCLVKLDCSQMDIGLGYVESESTDNQYKCAISQNSIGELKYLEELNCSNNCHITNIGHLGGILKNLNCSGPLCGIKQDSIDKMMILDTLDCSGNSNINNVDHIINTLKYLDCSSVIATIHAECFDEWIEHLDAISISYGDEKAVAAFRCGIKNRAINDLKRIKTLICNNDYGISNVDELHHILDVIRCRSRTLTPDDLFQLKKFKASYLRKKYNLNV